MPLENQSPLLEVRTWSITNPSIDNITKKQWHNCISHKLQTNSCSNTFFLLFSLSDVANYIINFSIRVIFFLFKSFGFSEVKQIRWAAFDVHMSRWFCFVSVVVTWFFSFSNCSRDFTRFCLLFSPWRDGYRGAKYSNPTLQLPASLIVAKMCNILADADYVCLCGAVPSPSW